MIGDARDGHALPRDALQVLDRADRHALAIEHRPLLDMQLEIGVRLEEAGRVRARVTDAFELGAEHRAVGPDGRERRLDRKSARMDQRAHHVGRVAHALLVGEGRDRDRPRRRESGTLECLDDVQPGKHAIAAIVDACVDHRIDVRADHHGRSVSGIPDPEDVADAIDRDLEPGLPHPGDELIAALSVGVRSREPRQPAVAVAADLTERTDAAEQARGVDCHGALLFPATTSDASSPTSAA